MVSLLLRGMHARGLINACLSVHARRSFVDVCVCVCVWLEERIVRYRHPSISPEVSHLSKASPTPSDTTMHMPLPKRTLVEAACSACASTHGDGEGRVGLGFTISG